MSKTSYQCPVVDDTGAALVGWIAALTGQCVYKPAEISWTLGWVSFVIWLGAQLPQIVENYMNKSVEGVSLFFLCIWFVGDLTNFAGCILTHQLPFQTALALYYIVVDSILLCQFVYYTYRPTNWAHHTHVTTLQGRPHREPSKLDNENEESMSESNVTQAVSIPSRRFSSSGIKALITSSFIASFGRVQSAPLFTETTSTVQDTFVKTLLSGNRAQVIGYISACVCACMYLASRIPQIYKNFQRKSTWGISIHLFIAALCGNFTYALSIITSPDARGPDGVKFLLNELPYLLGSAGTITFDLIIFGQYAIYGNQHPYISLQQSPEYDPPSYTEAGPSDWVPSRAQPVNSYAHHEIDEATPLAYSLQSNYSA